ncbi:hypothetical protein ACFQGE_12440 [Halomicroarcula sp. GCM10025817]|uniref:hypothetical protein n=1 Tax=Haloarcula TaxID=2237 RepID=UPI0023E8F5B2|nr:hypothetical protein [Halomicroarcula sp. SYNS111]
MRHAVGSGIDEHVEPLRDAILERDFQPIVSCRERGESAIRAALSIRKRRFEGVCEPRRIHDDCAWIASTAGHRTDRRRFRRGAGLCERDTLDRNSVIGRGCVDRERIQDPTRRQREERRSRLDSATGLAHEEWIVALPMEQAGECEPDDGISHDEYLSIATGVAGVGFQ